MSENSGDSCSIWILVLLGLISQWEMKGEQREMQSEIKDTQERVSSIERRQVELGVAEISVDSHSGDVFVGDKK